MLRQTQGVSYSQRNMQLIGAAFPSPAVSSDAARKINADGAPADTTSIPSMIATHMNVHTWNSVDGRLSQVVAAFPKSEAAPAREFGLFEDSVAVVAALHQYGIRTEVITQDQHANNIVSTSISLLRCAAVRFAHASQCTGT
jgi:hypothetical protein